MNTEEAVDTTQLNSVLPSSDTALRAEIFVRSLAPVSRKRTQDELVDKLECLVETGGLTDVDLLVWGDSVCTAGPLSEVGSGERIVDAIGEFYALAAGSRISMAPFFHTSEVSAELTGESFHRIIPPRQCVALYDESELVAVFPSLIDGVAYTPREALAYLERRQEETPPAPMVDESA